jgi:hypothetical protein
LQTECHQFIELGGIMTVTSETRPESSYLSVITGRDEEPDAARTSSACVIPAYNEQDTIAEVLTWLLNQTRLPDVIRVGIMLLVASLRIST